MYNLSNESKKRGDTGILLCLSSVRQFAKKIVTLMSDGHKTFPHFSFRINAQSSLFSSLPNNFKDQNHQKENSSALHLSREGVIKAERVERIFLMSIQ